MRHNSEGAGNGFGERGTEGSVFGFENNFFGPLSVFGLPEVDGRGDDIALSNTGNLGFTTWGSLFSFLISLLEDDGSFRFVTFEAGLRHDDPNNSASLLILSSLCSSADKCLFSLAGFATGLLVTAGEGFLGVRSGEITTRGVRVRSDEITTRGVRVLETSLLVTALELRLG